MLLKDYIAVRDSSLQHSHYQNEDHFGCFASSSGFSRRSWSFYFNRRGKPCTFELLSWILSISLSAKKSVGALGPQITQLCQSQVMCNCKSPNNKMWTNFKKMASEKCNKFPAGTPGHSSCVANALGYVSIFVIKKLLTQTEPNLTVKR